MEVSAIITIFNNSEFLTKSNMFNNLILQKNNFIDDGS